MSASRSVPLAAPAAPMPAAPPPRTTIFLATRASFAGVGPASAFSMGNEASTILCTPATAVKRVGDVRRALPEGRTDDRGPQPHRLGNRAEAALTAQAGGALPAAA